ncbi:hypothetical protein H6G97_06390 [Nostoc flagelliforme FACHB-838]|uniref:PIN domain-containing protein n=1 Tax=Nostoc flagelliforme FACHB-838 TaxID=2692904 RepID=A0ABR8DJQ9_9NOSO|nr:hypothetical protein [Nostoc flagelliforme]MBD2529218.1 hypothetical protein [Nostoc flagelliforme FACHB-838]
MKVLLNSNVILDVALDLEASFDALWQKKVGKTDYGKGKKSLLQLTLNEIRAANSPHVPGKFRNCSSK